MNTAPSGGDQEVDGTVLVHVAHGHGIKPERISRNSAGEGLDEMAVFARLWLRGTGRITASFVATAVPPCMLLIYLALLCAVQVFVTANDMVQERRAESEELELVAERRTRKIVSSNTLGSVMNPPIY